MKSLLSPVLLSDVTDHLALVLIIVGGALLVSAAVVLLVAKLRKKKANSFSGNDWLIALGDKDNIKEVMATGSRLSVVLNDKEKIDREKLKELGVSSVLVMSNKVTLVIEDKAESVAASIQKEL